MVSLFLALDNSAGVIILVFINYLGSGIVVVFPPAYDKGTGTVVLVYSVINGSSTVF